MGGHTSWDEETSTKSRESDKALAVVRKLASQAVVLVESEGFFEATDIVRKQDTVMSSEHLSRKIQRGSVEDNFEKSDSSCRLVIEFRLALGGSSSRIKGESRRLKASTLVILE